MIDALRERFKLKDLLPIFSINKSSYCYCSKALRADEHADLRKRIRQLFEENDGRYGYRRIRSLLHREGVAVSEKVVRRLMKEERLVVVFVKKKRYSSYKGELSPEVPNPSIVIFMRIHRGRNCLPTSRNSASPLVRFISLLSWTAMTE